MPGTRSEASVTSTSIAPFPAGTIRALQMMIAFRERDRDEVHGTGRSPEGIRDIATALMRRSIIAPCPVWIYRYD